MFGIGVQEFGLILIVALLVFGPKRLPELARMLGRGMGEFRRASNDLRQSLALDDLQNDLRRDLKSTTQSMLKPDAQSRSSEDRPAQAGDEIHAPNQDPAAPAETEKHHGELPLGNDDEHHDLSEAEAESEPKTESGPTPSGVTGDAADSGRG